MADIRVNGNGGRGYSTSQNGTAGNEYQGVYGLQKALSNISAGDKILLYAPSSNQMRMDYLVSLTSTQSWSAGQLVRNNTGSGDDWTGIICEATGTTLLVELITGSYATIAIADGVENTTLSQTATITNKNTPPGITVTSKSGNANGYNVFQGCNSSYDADQLAYLDGNDVCNVPIWFNACNYWQMSYMVFRQAATDGIRWYTGNCDYWRISYCIGEDNGNDGFEAYTLRFSTFVQCIGRNNGYTGFNISAVNALAFCKATGNSREGIVVASNYVVIHDSVIANNTRSNIRIATFDIVRIIANVIHGAGSGYSGILLDTGCDGIIVERNRITGNAAYGINNADSDYSNYEDYNYFQGNTSGHRNNVLTGANSIDGSDTDYGYTDYTNGDFSLTSSASLRNTAVNLDWDV